MNGGKSRTQEDWFKALMGIKCIGALRIDTGGK